MFAAGQTLTILGGPRVRGAVSPVGAIDQAPVLTPYVDPLLGLSQWPSVVASWRVLPPATAPQLVLQLLFDDRCYQGMVAAVATGATTIVATFTEPLDPATATSPTNYTVDPAVDVHSAALGADQVTVTLVVGTLSANTTYSLRAQAVKTAGQKVSFDELAGFVYPDDPNQRTSKVRNNAARDLKVYSWLHDQLTDPNGIALSVRSNLLRDTLALSTSQMADLLAWLFVGTSTTGSICAFLAERATASANARLPPAKLRVDFALPQGQINTAQIFELWLDFGVARTGGSVLDELETTPGIRQTQTRVAPYQTDVPNGQKTPGLTQFARDFEDALSQADYRLKVATGVHRATASCANVGTTLWAVRLGLGAGQAISFAINDGSTGKPAVFAPRPISPVLENLPGVPIRDYTSGEGLSPTPSRRVDFNSVDIDVWVSALFAAVDGVLTPRYMAPILIVGQYFNGTNYLQQVLDAKRKLATVVKQWMIPVYADEKADPAEIQECFCQQLLVRLSNAYRVRAGLQFDASVAASITGPLDQEPPRLCGGVELLQPGSTMVFTSPQLSLLTGPERPLAFLLSAAEGVAGVGEVVVSVMDLPLVFNGTRIEHQVGRVSGIDGYQASSGLSFVVRDADWPLAAALGSVQVPMVLRPFPAAPGMTAQEGHATYANPTTVQQLSMWDYSFTYSLAFHYPQDRVHAIVDFRNVDHELPAQRLGDAFSQQLAQFVTVFPEVAKDLDGILATIDATVDPVKDAQKIKTAAVAIGAFVDMLTDIIAPAGPTGLLPPGGSRRRSGDPLAYEFQVDEDVVQHGATLAALLVTVSGTPPNGVGTPVVMIDDAEHEPVLITAATDHFGYVFRKRATTDEYLTAAQGQAIASRTVVLPALDLFQRPLAWSTVYLARNEELAGQAVASPFVYTTPDVQCAAPLHPTIDSQAELAIENIDASSLTMGSPQTRSLAEHLRALFSALLAENRQPVITIQSEVTYEYCFGTGAMPAVLPILLMAALEVDVTPTGSASPDIAGGAAAKLAAMIDAWTAKIEEWFAVHSPTGGGTLWFDLAIRSNLAGKPMPLLRAGRLRLSTDYVRPPLS